MIKISTRIDEKVANEIEEIASSMNLEKDALIRKYILDGYQRSGMKRNIELVKNDEITIGQAAMNSGVSIYRIMEFARELGIQIDADATTLGYEFEVLKKHLSL